MATLQNETTNSQCAQILEHLQAGKTITSYEAMQQYGCMRLASRISDLKSQDFPIEKVMVKVENRYGKTVRVAQYYLKEKQGA